MVPTVKLTETEPAPPPLTVESQVWMIFGGLAICIPVGETGKVSVRLTPVRSVVAFGLVNVNVTVDGSLALI